MVTLNISGKTKICGLLGCPVEHSFSPAMHNAAFGAVGLDWAYLPFHVEPSNLTEAVKGIKALNLKGVNVTVPHKQSVLPLVDLLDRSASLIGAVNTIVNREGQLVGYNTDGSGFVKALALEAGFNPVGKTALILGAGGAARAVAVQLALEGLKTLYITNRSSDKAIALASQIKGAIGTDTAVLPWGEQLPGTEVAKSDLIVQTTNLGMSPEVNQYPSFPFSELQRGQLVCDLIYNPRQTAFLSLAAHRGATTLNGLGMLLYQGVLAFELWTGAEAPVAVMKEALQRQAFK